MDGHGSGNHMRNAFPPITMTTDTKPAAINQHPHVTQLPTDVDHLGTNLETNVFPGERVLAVAVVISALILVLYPVFDPDVFWHIKTGEWIWRHKALPGRDPFTFTIDPTLYAASHRPYAILQSYWLSQIILYAFHSLFGLYGIILFRCIVYFGILFFLYQRMRKLGLRSTVVFFFLVPTLLVIYIYGGERPNTLSYLIAAIFFCFLDDFVKDKAGKGLAIPSLMLLWPAMHGGFLLGEILLAIYGSVILVKSFVQGQWLTRRYKLLLLLVSMLVPLLHVGARETILMMLKDPTLATPILIAEHVSIFTWARHGDYSFIAVMILVGLLILPSVKHLTTENMLTFVFLFIISIMSIRYLPFLIILMTPIVSVHYASRPAFTLKEPFFRHTMYGTILVCCICVGVSGYYKSLFKQGIIADFYPSEAVSFINRNKLSGPIFNDYTWGGYIIYSLKPRQRIFIDGRNISLSVLSDYAKVLSYPQQISSQNMRPWQAIFRDYDIQIVIIPTYSGVENKFNILVKRLIDDPFWHLVFCSEKNSGMVFVRDTPGHQDLIKRFTIDKQSAYEKITSDLLRNDKESWRSNLQAGIVSAVWGKFDKAETYFEIASQINSRLPRREMNDVLVDRATDLLDTRPIVKLYGY